MHIDYDTSSIKNAYKKHDIYDYETARALKNNPDAYQVGTYYIVHAAQNGPQATWHIREVNGIKTYGIGKHPELIEKEEDAYMPALVNSLEGGRKRKTHRRKTNRRKTLKNKRYRK